MIFEYELDDNIVETINKELACNSEGYNDDGVEYVIIPCCDNEHWVVIEWVKEEDELVVFNSLKDYSADGFVEIVKNYLDNNTKIKIKEDRCILCYDQEDLWSCGYRAMCCIHELVYDQLYETPYFIGHHKNRQFIQFITEKVKWYKQKTIFN